MTILVPPRADPNIACAVEWFSHEITVQGAHATSCTITLTPEVSYAAPPAVVGVPQHVKDDGSLATTMTWAITEQTTAGVTITVTLDQAPGAGKTDTIIFNGGLIGIPAR